MRRANPTRLVRRPRSAVAPYVLYNADHLDVKVAKCVQRKLFHDKEQRFSGAESHVGALFPRLVRALREVFVTEDAAIATLFTLDDATASVRVEANRLLYSTLELLVDPQLARGRLDGFLKHRFPARGWEAGATGGRSTFATP
ncbi:hypothetical protein CYMTET_27265 [Cymbomonas tetramitiformis]|uniref:Uncharacterized protein n=1 Tax=Cymbomonas tetramitiformis TaxID=36881 RepID=A0AAE0FQ45_9CHLO|nr:hypothetical protein CYMTET_27265 [Cymbomonas tetramitiformis]